jgi:hypothetical protein
MLLVWAVWALAFNGPGWIHLLLTLGVTLLIYRVVLRGTRTTNGRDRNTAARD